MKSSRALIVVLAVALAFVPLFSTTVLAATYIYTNSASLAVPDSNSVGVNSTINVPNSVTISDLNVALNISSTWVGDVRVRLTSPAGTTITLVDQPGLTGTGCCGYGSDNIITTLDDESGGGPVENADPPTGPSYRPQQPLSAFDGQNAAGTWTLNVADISSFDATTLNSWSLIIKEPVTPVANSDTASVSAAGSATVPVTGNDMDADGTINPATVAVTSGPTCGTAVPNGSGGVLYTNTNVNCTSDLFAYTVRDNDGLTSNAATVAITINPVPPVAVNDTGSVVAGSSVTIPVTTNDTDVDGTINGATVAVTSGPTCGTAAPDGAGGMLYTNTDVTCTADSFTYTVQDDDGLTSNAATVLLGINNAPPVAVDDQVELVVGSALNIRVTANDTDVDGTVVLTSVTIVTNPTCGTVSVDGTGGVWYTNTDTSCAGDTFSYTIQDDDGVTSLPAAVVIGVVAVPPPVIPTPPPAPRCNDMDFDEDGVVRAWLPDSYRQQVYCHLIVENGGYVQWYGGPITNAGQIGVASVLEQNVQQAVDVFSPTGLGWYEGGAVVCLRGAGDLWFLPAAGVPRSAEPMTEYEVPEFAGFTCTTVYMPGTLALTGAPVSQAASAPAESASSK